MPNAALVLKDGVLRCNEPLARLQHAGVNIFLHSAAERDLQKLCFKGRHKKIPTRNELVNVVSGRIVTVDLSAATTENRAAPIVGNIAKMLFGTLLSLCFTVAFTPTVQTTAGTTV